MVFVYAMRIFVIMFHFSMRTDGNQNEYADFSIPPYIRKSYILSLNLQPRWQKKMQIRTSRLAFIRAP